MTDKTPKLPVDALGAINSAQEFVGGSTLAIDLRNRIIHGCDAVDDKIVY